MSDTDRFELYAFWRTSATYRVRVALRLKGLTAQEHFIDLDKGEQRSPAYLKINPLGGIPSLVEAGHAPLTQSLAILEFLEERQPLPALLPADAHGRARVRSLARQMSAMLTASPWQNTPVSGSDAKRSSSACKPVLNQ